MERFRRSCCGGDNFQCDDQKISPRAGHARCITCAWSSQSGLGGEKDVRMRTLQVSTKNKREVVDLTALCRNELAKERVNGVCHLFVLHTTAALTIADLDPGTDLDLLDVAMTNESYRPS